MDIVRKKFSLLEEVDVTLFLFLTAVVSVVGVVDVVVYGSPTTLNITGLAH